MILGAETGAGGEVIVYLLHDSLGDRDQSIFAELGLFDADESPLPFDSDA